ncbi:MAG TPA: ROK family glucokinase [Actinomycetota bacterium]|nr:ROK family glucokinase [Actinomycetota bacterium]
MVVTVGIDVGGTKIAAGVVDESGTIVARRQIPTQAADPVQVVAGITKIATEMKALAPAARAVGVGAAGLIDVARGVVIDAPNIAWQNVHLRAMLEERVKLPVLVDNDANAAAWGEALYGAGKGAGDQVMVTVGTGIGGGLVVNGALYHGALGIGAEIGHMIVHAGGAVCACGARGCLEAMASGTAIGRLARERAHEEGAAPVIARAGSVETITGEVVGDAAAHGDPFAADVIAEAGRWLGVGLASLVNLLDPDIIVVGGGAAGGCGELLLEPARRSMASHVVSASLRALPPVVAAALGADAGIVGAATLARAVV